MEGEECDDERERNEMRRGRGMVVEEEECNGRRERNEMMRGRRV